MLAWMADAEEGQVFPEDAVDGEGLLDLGRGVPGGVAGLVGVKYAGADGHEGHCAPEMLQLLSARGVDGDGRVASLPAVAVGV